MQYLHHAAAGNGYQMRGGWLRMPAGGSSPGSAAWGLWSTSWTWPCGRPAALGSSGSGEKTTGPPS